MAFRVINAPPVDWSGLFDRRRDDKDEIYRQMMRFQRQQLAQQGGRDMANMYFQQQGLNFQREQFGAQQQTLADMIGRADEETLRTRKSRAFDVRAADRDAEIAAQKLEHDIANERDRLAGVRRGNEVFGDLGDRISKHIKDDGGAKSETAIEAAFIEALGEFDVGFGDLGEDGLTYSEGTGYGSVRDAIFARMRGLGLGGPARRTNREHYAAFFDAASLGANTESAQWNAKVTADQAAFRGLGQGGMYEGNLADYMDRLTNADRADINIDTTISGDLAMGDGPPAYETPAIREAWATETAVGARDLADVIATATPEEIAAKVGEKVEEALPTGIFDLAGGIGDIANAGYGRLTGGARLDPPVNLLAAILRSIGDGGDVDAPGLPPSPVAPAPSAQPTPPRPAAGYWEGPRSMWDLTPEEREAKRQRIRQGR